MKIIRNYLYSYVFNLIGIGGNGELFKKRKLEIIGINITK